MLSTLTSHAMGPALQVLFATLVLACVLSILAAWRGGLVGMPVLHRACTITLSVASIALSDMYGMGLMFITYDEMGSRAWMERVFALPLWTHVSVVALLLACSCAELIYIGRWRAHHLLPSSIKEAVDLLPRGIGIAYPQGTILLANEAMAELARTLQGTSFVDLDRLWEAAQSVAERVEGPETLIRNAEGRALLLRRTEVRAEEGALLQLTATDVTELQATLMALRERTDLLEAMKQRLAAYGRQLRETVQHEELLRARTFVHDELGHAILQTEYVIDHEGPAGTHKLADLWEHTIVLMEAGEPGTSDTDAFGELIGAAHALGVDIDISGDLPREGRAHDLLLRALRECVLNCAKHAHGSLVSLDVTRCDESVICATLTNDGDVPAGEIRESGGLASLRQAVEDAGGTMAVESAPAFRLVLMIEG